VTHARALFGFVCDSGRQELDPILDPVLGEDENDAVKLLFRDLLLLRFPPKEFSERLPVVTAVDESCRAASGSAVAGPRFC